MTDKEEGRYMKRVPRRFVRGIGRVGNKFRIEESVRLEL